MAGIIVGYLPIFFIDEVWSLAARPWAMLLTIGALLGATTLLYLYIEVQAAARRQPSRVRAGAKDLLLGRAPAAGTVVCSPAAGALMAARNCPGGSERGGGRWRSAAAGPFIGQLPVVLARPSTRPFGGLHHGVHVVLHRDLLAIDVGRHPDHRAAVAGLSHRAGTGLVAEASNPYSRSPRIRPWCASRSIPRVGVPTASWPSACCTGKASSGRRWTSRRNPRRRREMIEARRTTVPQIWIGNGTSRLRRPLAAGRVGRARPAAVALSPSGDR